MKFLKGFQILLEPELHWQSPKWPSEVYEEFHKLTLVTV